METLRAEVISIGDEITSGVRLDTNSQWISQQLGKLGVLVAFHSSARDQQSEIVGIFRNAASRVQVIVCTGGLGPTADDLTRQAIAELAGVDLVLDQSVLQKIEAIFQTRGRPMPPNNERQAWFPHNSTIIDNPEGSAPGIYLTGSARNDNEYRIFALPGVPVEMKQMWTQTVEPELKRLVGEDWVIHHHTLHCFGAGESQIETMLPDLIRRGRNPQVGITASSATISLRITAREPTMSQCLQRIQPTIDTINQCLGDLVFGENGQELQHIVTDLLESNRNTLAIVDAGLQGDVATLISQAKPEILLAGETTVAVQVDNLGQVAQALAAKSRADFGIAIGPIDHDQELIASGKSFFQVAIAEAASASITEQAFRFSGHSGWRQTRAAKDVLNFLRLFLRDRHA